MGMNQEKDREKETKFAKENMSYPILLGMEQAFGDYKVQGYPTSYFIDKSGVVRYRDVGFGPGMEGKLEAHITELLGEQVAGK